MRWVEEETEYRKKRDMARVCVDVDSGRSPTEKIKLYFCDVATINDKFLPLLHDLLLMASEQSCTYMVLDPDPEYFWHDRLGGYPVFELSRGDTPDEYLKFLNQPIGHNPGGNMADMWYSYAIFPPSLKWFAHTIRSDRDGTGHLWVPPEWAVGVASTYPFVRSELSRVADK